MFDIGWSEILIIVVVAIVVVGPKDLPRLMGTFGRYAGKLRRAAADFQRQFDDAIRETEVKKAMETVRAEAASLDQPVMLPKLETPSASPAQTPAPPTPVQEPPPAPLALAATSPEPQTKPKPARKSGASTKPKAASKTSGAKRGKAKAEPPHDG